MAFITSRLFKRLAYLSAPLLCLLCISKWVHSEEVGIENETIAYSLLFAIGASTDKVEPVIDENHLESEPIGIKDPNPRQLTSEQTKSSSYESHQAKSAAAWLLGSALRSNNKEKIQLDLNKYGNETPYQDPCSKMTKPSLVKNDPLTIQCFGR